MPIKTIMVVDDSPTDRAHLESLLRRNGYDVLLAESGEAAVARADRDLPDLILMDVVMPGHNGFEATRTISRGESTAHIPIIVCTSKRQATDRIWALRQGAKDFVSKPVDEADLIARIKRQG